jgi:hypothetical protein
MLTSKSGQVHCCGQLTVYFVVVILMLLTIIRDIPLVSYNSRNPWGRVANYQKKELSVVGENVDMGTDKSVTFKQCFIGNNCKIGQKSKLNNCVIMDNVVIGEKYVISSYLFPFTYNFFDVSIAVLFKTR